MKDLSQSMDPLGFTDLEGRFGWAQAFRILRSLEQFEGVREVQVSKLSYEERLKNVFRLMSDTPQYQTCH